MVKVGVIGLGKMGRMHLRNCRHIDGVKVVAAADVSKKGLRRARDLGVKQLYQDYTKMLEGARVDAVIICLPNYLHVESICAVAEAGKDIFVEKPLARTTAECKEIINAVQRHGVKLMVGHNYRFFDCVEKVKDLVDKGVIGDVEIATLELVINGPFAPSFEPTPIPEWYFDAEKIGMGCLDSGYHLIDLFQWFFGDAEVLYAYLGYRYHLPYEDSAIVVLRSKGGSTKGVMNVGWISKVIFPHFNFRINLHGTAGFISTDQFTPTNLHLHAAKEAMKNFLRKVLGMKIHPLTYTYYYASYLKELHCFFDCIKDDNEPVVTPKDALETTKVIEEVYKLCHT